MRPRYTTVCCCVQARYPEYLSSAGRLIKYAWDSCRAAYLVFNCHNRCSPRRRTQQQDKEAKESHSGRIGNVHQGTWEGRWILSLLSVTSRRSIVQKEELWGRAEALAWQLSLHHLFENLPLLRVLPCRGDNVLLLFLTTACLSALCVLPIITYVILVSILRWK